MLEKNNQDLSYFKSKERVHLESNFTKNISLSLPKYIDAGEAEATGPAIHIKADHLLNYVRKEPVLSNELGINSKICK